MNRFFCKIVNGLRDLECMQALLAKTLSDYEKVGYDPKSSSLEIRLIQSQDYIRNPEVKYKAEKYN